MKQAKKAKRAEKIQSPLRVGANVLIRTVTLYHTGHVVALDDREILLTDAAWIADTGRFHDAIKNSTLNEVEPIPGPVMVNRGAVIDVCEWRGARPTVQR